MGKAYHFETMIQAHVETCTDAEGCAWLASINLVKNQTQKASLTFFPLHGYVYICSYIQLASVQVGGTRKPSKHSKFQKLNQPKRRKGPIKHSIYVPK